MPTHIVKFFPRTQYASMTKNQECAFEFLEQCSGETNIIEAPTGTGKTAIGYTWLQAQGKGVKFYLVPNKSLVGQVVALHPDMQPMFGRNEHDCLYYQPHSYRADEIPCSMLNCGHRVSLETGETQDPSSMPCPYLLQKYKASKSSTIVATYAFYLYTVFFGGKDSPFTPVAVVVDEAHGIAKSIRGTLVFTISEQKVRRIIEALSDLGSKEIDDLERFVHEMKLLAKRRKSWVIDRDSVLEYEEIQALLNTIELVNVSKIQGEVSRALAEGALDPERDREAMNQLTTVLRDLKHYIRALKFSLPPSPVENTRRRHPLSYAYAYWEKAYDGEEDHFELVIKDYYVAALVKTMLPKNTLAYSATVIDPEVFAIENGISGNYLPLGSDFPTENARIFMPTDTEDLSMKGRSNRSLPKTIRKIVRTAKRFALRGKRSLIVVVSEFERQKVLAFAKEEGLHALSYDKDTTARYVMQSFQDGKGDCLVGTVANYGEGIDLPDGIAPIIFCLRPGYPNPADPQTAFEEARFGSARWKVWNWRVMIDLLQVRGRNIRSVSDKGVTFLMSQQFRRFARGALPHWLMQAYVNNKPFDECVTETEKFL